MPALGKEPGEWYHSRQLELHREWRERRQLDLLAVFLAPLDPLAAFLLPIGGWRRRHRSVLALLPRVECSLEPCAQVQPQRAEAAPERAARWHPDEPALKRLAPRLRPVVELPHLVAAARMEGALEESTRLGDEEFFGPLW